MSLVKNYHCPLNKVRTLLSNDCLIENIVVRHECNVGYVSEFLLKVIRTKLFALPHCSHLLNVHHQSAVLGTIIHYFIPRRIKHMTQCAFFFFIPASSELFASNILIIASLLFQDLVNAKLISGPRNRCHRSIHRLF